MNSTIERQGAGSRATRPVYAASQIIHWSVRYPGDVAWPGQVHEGSGRLRWNSLDRPERHPRSVDRAGGQTAAKVRRRLWSGEQTSLRTVTSQRPEPVHLTVAL